MGTSTIIRIDPGMDDWLLIVEHISFYIVQKPFQKVYPHGIPILDFVLNGWFPLWCRNRSKSLQVKWSSDGQPWCLAAFPVGFLLNTHLEESKAIITFFRWMSRIQLYWLIIQLCGYVNRWHASKIQVFNRENEGLRPCFKTRCLFCSFHICSPHFRIFGQPHVVQAPQVVMELDDD